MQTFILNHLFLKYWLHLTNKETLCGPNKTCLQTPRLPVYSKTQPLSKNPNKFTVAGQGIFLPG